MAIGDEPLVDASQAPAESCPVERCTSALIGMFMDRLRCYLKSLRIASFTTSLIPVLMGALLAYKTTGQFNLITLCATITTVLSVHAAGNLVNTYCDFVRGIDSKRLSDDRTLVDKILKPEQVVNLGKCCSFFRIIHLPFPTNRRSFLHHWLHRFPGGRSPFSSSS